MYETDSKQLKKATVPFICNVKKEQHTHTENKQKLRMTTSLVYLSIIISELVISMPNFKSRNFPSEIR